MTHPLASMIRLVLAGDGSYYGEDELEDKADAVDAAQGLVTSSPIGRTVQVYPYVDAPPIAALVLTPKAARELAELLIGAAQDLES